MRILNKVIVIIAFSSTATLSKQTMASEPSATDTTVTPKQGLAAFDKMMKVLTHKRCVNCHPKGDSPRQGDDSHIHTFGVTRGSDNLGSPALRCKTCHTSENNPLSGAPGAPHWSLAPKSMTWEGLTRVQIAQSILDPLKNGGRDLDAIVHHLTEHELVLWAWAPGKSITGKQREKPPVSKEDYIKAVKTWATAGAPIPEK